MKHEIEITRVIALLDEVLLVIFEDMLQEHMPS